MRTEQLDFDLPPELIAQTPAVERAASRLLHYQRSTRTIAHRTFSDLPHLLKRGDLLVFNDSRVIPARLALRKNTGGLIEGLFLHEDSPGRWRVMLKNASNIAPVAATPASPLPSGQREATQASQVQSRSINDLTFSDAPDIHATIEQSFGGGEYLLRVETTEPAVDLLTRVGRMPLPPYIKRDKGHDARDELDRQRYQTVYARDLGSVAAPTAGLHFTPAILEALRSRGVEEAFVTLHVGMGTFKPVTADTLEDHPMHSEVYSISPEAALMINAAKKEGRRVIAVGTTSARVLESQPADRPIEPTTGSTRIFIYPPYRWRHVDALITNFHLPRSTLIALVAAMTGLDEQRRIYAEAIKQRYRFFSYGDAMFVD